MFKEILRQFCNKNTFNETPQQHDFMALLIFKSIRIFKFMMFTWSKQYCLKRKEFVLVTFFQVSLK